MGVIIRLLDKEGGNVEDSLSGDYEDSFCLETFEDLCKAHFSAEPPNTKGFIIARVKTLDPKQPDKTFYSYYSAYQLNKTLFQTQIYLKKKYIHRLHVLNPLTNSDIIGTVDYFLVKPPQTNENVVLTIDPPAETVVDTNQSMEGLVNTARRVSLVYTQPVKQGEENVPKAESPLPQELPITTHKIALEEGKKQIPNFLRRGSAAAAVPKQRDRRVSLFERPIQSMTTEINPKKKTGLKITTNLPTGAYAVGDRGCMSATVGQVTRFAIPVPEEELKESIPPTQRGNRRSLSYRNAVSATGQPITFLEWAKMVKEESDVLKKSDDTHNDFDKVQYPRRTSVAKGNAAEKLVTPLETMHEEDEQTTPSGSAPPNASKAETKEDEEDEPLIVYDAILVANDNDFLEQSKTRQLFRNNAINPADAKLFEMKEYTGKNDDNDFEIMNDAFLCECCYPTEQQLSTMSPAARFFHVNKFVMFVLIIPIAVIIVIIVYGSK